MQQKREAPIHESGGIDRAHTIPHLMVKDDSYSPIFQRFPQQQHAHYPIYDSASYNALNVLMANQQTRSHLIPCPQRSAPFLRNRGYHLPPIQAHKVHLRRGKWSPEEEAYTARIIQNFSTGVLQLPEGTTLRVYLAEKLQCDPMRITKKFTGSSCLGKRVYHSCERTPATQSEIELSRKELEKLEAVFLEQLQRKNKRYISNQEIDSVTLGSQPTGIEFDPYSPQFSHEFVQPHGHPSHWGHQQIVFAGYDPNSSAYPVSYPNGAYLQQYGNVTPFVQNANPIYVPQEVSYPYVSAMIPQHFSGTMAYAQHVPQPPCPPPQSQLVPGCYPIRWTSAHPEVHQGQIQYVPTAKIEQTSRNHFEYSSADAASKTQEMIRNRDVCLPEGLISKKRETFHCGSMSGSNASDTTTLDCLNSNGSAGTDNGSNSSGGEGEIRDEKLTRNYRTAQHNIRNHSCTSSSPSNSDTSAKNMSHSNEPQISLSETDGAGALITFYKSVNRQHQHESSDKNEKQQHLTSCSKRNRAEIHTAKQMSPIYSCNGGVDVRKRAKTHEMKTDGKK